MSKHTFQDPDAEAIYLGLEHLVEAMKAQQRTIETLAKEIHALRDERVDDIISGE